MFVFGGNGWKRGMHEKTWYWMGMDKMRDGWVGKTKEWEVKIIEEGRIGGEMGSESEALSLEDS